MKKNFSLRMLSFLFLSFLATSLALITGLTDAPQKRARNRSVYVADFKRVEKISRVLNAEGKVFLISNEDALLFKEINIQWRKA